MLKKIRKGNFCTTSNPYDFVQFDRLQRNFDKTDWHTCLYKNSPFDLMCMCPKTEKKVKIFFKNFDKNFQKIMLIFHFLCYPPTPPYTVRRRSISRINFHINMFIQHKNLQFLSCVAMNLKGIDTINYEITFSLRENWYFSHRFWKFWRNQKVFEIDEKVSPMKMNKDVRKGVRNSWKFDKFIFPYFHYNHTIIIL